MKPVLTLFLAGLAVLPASAASAQSRNAPPRAPMPETRSMQSDQAYRAVQSGQILPLRAIRERVRIDGATLIGADLMGGGIMNGDPRYRLRFMRRHEIIWVDVDARTGRVLGRVGG